MTYQEIVSILGSEAESLLEYKTNKIQSSLIDLPRPGRVEETFSLSDRSQTVLESLSQLYNHGRLAGTGYLSIFPVDQGLEHTAGYSFAENPLFFDPENIVRFAIEGGSSAVVSSASALGMISEKYKLMIPFIVKLNHSEHLTLPEKSNQIMYSSVERAWNLGALGVGATIYFGSDESHRQIEEVSEAFEVAHNLGMFTILWCYPRNPNYKKDGKNYETAIDISAQACHLGVTVGADIIKQKLPQALHGFDDLGFSKSSEKMYELIGNHPIDLVRYQVLNCFSGKVGLINSGGESSGESDLKDAIRTAVINKRAGGTGLIMGRKLFKRDWRDGLKILQAVQDVYLDKQVSIA